MIPDSPEVARLKQVIADKTTEIATLNAALLKSQDECARLRAELGNHKFTMAVDAFVRANP